MALSGTDRGTGGNGTASTSLTCSPTSNCTAGAMLVLVVAYENSGTAGADPYSSISDNKGNTWTSRQRALYDPAASGAGQVVGIFTCQQNVAALTTGDTITVTVSSSARWAYALIEVVGGIYVQGGAGTGAGTGTPTVTTASITNANMVVGGGGAESADTWAGDADTSHGLWSAHQHTGFGSGNTGVSVTAQYKVVSATATQTYNPTVTSSNCILAWIEVCGPAISPRSHGASGARALASTASRARGASAVRVLGATIARSRGSTTPR